MSAVWWRYMHPHPTPTNLLPGVYYTVANSPLLSMTPAVNFVSGTAGVIDTGSIFATGVNDTGGK